MKDTHKKKLMAVSGMNEIPFVSEGIESGTAGYVVSEDGMTKIAEALEKSETDSSAATEKLQNDLNAANAAKKKAEDDLAAANAAKTKVETDLATATARIEELEADGAVTQTIKQDDKTGKTTVPYHESADNPLNKIADSLLGAPAPKE